MPYIAVELDAKKMVPSVARAVSLPESQIGWGLVCLWEWCWSQKLEDVRPVHLQGFFGHDGERMAEALEAFGFLAKNQEGYRVKGAGRYLRVSAAQTLNGKKRATAQRDALGRLVGSGGSAGAAAGEPASRSPAASQPPASHSPALTPTTDDRRPKEESPVGWLRDAIDTEFKARTGKAYPWTPKCETAIGALLGQAHGDEAEVAQMFRVGLGMKFPEVSTLTDLSRHWPAVLKAAANPQPRAGPPTQADKDAEHRAKHGVIPGVNSPCILLNPRPK